MTHGHFRGCLRFSFAELKKPAIYIFSRNLHLLRFPTIYSLPCFPLNGAHTNFFPEDTREGPSLILCEDRITSSAARLSVRQVLKRIFQVFKQSLFRHHKSLFRAVLIERHGGTMVRALGPVSRKSR